MQVYEDYFYIFMAKNGFSLRFLHKMTKIFDYVNN